jgi:hypothetical protein
MDLRFLAVNWDLESRKIRNCTSVSKVQINTLREGGSGKQKVIKNSKVNLKSCCPIVGVIFQYMNNIIIVVLVSYFFVK